MSLLQEVLDLDIAYLDTFTNRINTTWGYMFYDEKQPNYYDANHAHISQIPHNPKSIIEEVIHFYQEKNIPPRFYIYNYEKQFNLIEALTSYHFQVELLVSPVQKWNRQLNEQKENNKVSIEKVTEANYEEALNIECSISEFGGKEVREIAFSKEFHHPSFTQYILRYEGEACSTACLFQHGNQIRLESVATKEKFRGKGLIGELIYFLQKEVRNRNINDFWVFPINEKIEKVYSKYGFETIGKFTTAHAFLEGKSIKEIQGI